MKSLTLRTLLILSLASPAFAGNSAPIDEQAKQVEAASEVTPADASPIGTLEELSDRLLELTKPMEKKVDDCDGEVAAAQKKLAELQDAFKKEANTLRKTFAEILLLKESLGSSGCDIIVGGTRFRRELVADGLEKRLGQYQQTAESVKQLRTSVAAQKEVVANAIAKLERWQAKEKELLQSVEALQVAHADLLGTDEQEFDIEKLDKAKRVETEVKAMLKPTAQKPSKQEATEAAVEVDISEVVTENETTDVSSKTTEAIDVEVVPTASGSVEKQSDDNKTAEVTVDIEVEANLETDTEFNLEILDEIFERP